MGGFDDPGTPVPGVEIDAGIVSLTKQLLGNLRVVVVVVVLVHVSPKYGIYNTDFL